MNDLKLFAKDKKGIEMPDQKTIAAEAAKTITDKFGYTKKTR